MKRAIYIFFILLADMTILAHTVIPHHHHYRNNMLITEIDLFDRSSFDLFHRHCNYPNSKDTEECPISDTIATVTPQSLKEERFDSDFFKPIEGNSLLCIVSENCSVFECTHTQSVPCLFKPYLEKSLLNEDFCTSALRAPPVC